MPEYRRASITSSRACEKRVNVLVAPEIALFVLNLMRFVSKNACNVRTTEPLKDP